MFFAVETIVTVRFRSKPGTWQTRHTQGRTFKLNRDTCTHKHAHTRAPVHTHTHHKSEGKGGDSRVRGGEGGRTEGGGKREGGREGGTRMGGGGGGGGWEKESE